MTVRWGRADLWLRRAPGLIRRLARPEPAPADAETIRLERLRVVAASRGLRRLAPGAARPGAGLDEIEAALGLDADARAALAALARRGERFSRRIALAGRAWEFAGAPAGAALALTLRDVTEAAAAEAAAAAARERAEAEAAALRAVLEDLPDPVWLETPEGRPLWRNAAARALPAPPEDRRRVEAAPGGPVARIGAGPRAEAASQRALRAFIETVTETFAHLRVGLAIFGEGRRLTLCNPAVAEVFSIDPAVLAARPTLRELLDHLRMARRLPEHADYPAWRARLFTLFDDPAQPGLNEIWHLPDSRSINVVARPHPLGGVAFLFEDMTPSLDLAREKSTVEEVFRQTIETLAVGVAVIGADGRPRVANPALRAMWGLPPPGSEEMAHVAGLAAACRRLDAKPDVWETIRAEVASGRPRGAWSGRVTLADGRTLDARISPMPDQSTLAAFLDVSDGARVAEALRERAEALEAAEEMRTALADQLSHRLRTPLTTVLGFGQMLAEGRAGPLAERQRGYVESIVNAGQLLLESIETLADLASVAPEDVRGAAAPVTVEGPFRGALALAERRAAERGARIESGAVDPEARVRGEATALRRLVYTLLSDAVSRAEGGDVIRAGVSAEAAQVEIWCEAPGAADAKPNGLARRVAALIGGALSAETTPEGGARLVCRLPSAADA